MTRSISELALATIDELDRRGWTKGKLGELEEYDSADIVSKAILEEDCKVCLVGAMSSAYNPYHPFIPGYNEMYAWDVATEKVIDQTPDPDYQRFVDAVFDELPDRAVMRHSVSSLTWFNDSAARTVEDLKVLLLRVAEKHRQEGVSGGE